MNGNNNPYDVLDENNYFEPIKVNINNKPNYLLWVLIGLVVINLAFNLGRLAFLYFR